MKWLFALLLVFLLFPLPVQAEISYIQRAVNRINTEVNYVSAQFPTVPRDFFVALSTLGYVHNQVNPYVYGYYRSISETIDSVEEALEKQAGLCGTQSWVYATLIRELGLQARTIQIYQMDRYNGGSHVVTEVYFNGKWNLIDSTTGTFYRNGKMYELMSFEEINGKANFSDYVVSSQSGMSYQAWKYKGVNPYPYILSTTKDVLISRKGVLNLHPVGNNYPLTNLENHVGKAWFKLDNCYGNVSYKFHDIAGATKLKLVVSGNRGEGNLILTCGSQQMFIPSFEGERIIDLSAYNLSQGLTMTAIPSSGETCYYVFSKIEMMP